MITRHKGNHPVTKVRFQAEIGPESGSLPYKIVALREAHQYYLAAATALCAGIEPNGERVAVPAGQQTQSPGLDSYDAIVAACKEAWNFLINDPERIRSIGTRDWACVSI